MILSAGTGAGGGTDAAGARRRRWMMRGRGLFRRILIWVMLLPVLGAGVLPRGRCAADGGGAETLRIAVASDLHLNPDNRPEGGNPTQAAYSMELTDALLWDAGRNAEILILTGDLVHSGRLYRHEALAGKLRRAEESGLAVYVLPGNHDLAPVTQTEFARLYEDFGYGEAFSRDRTSLSYCAVVGDLMLLMMDCGGYPMSAFDLPGAAREAAGYVTDRYTVSGPVFLSESTLAWAAEMLETAQARGLRIICAGHYNLLSPASLTEGSGYYIENGRALAALLEEAEVPLYLSGHMHLRGVYREKGLTELMTECLTAYPVAWGLLEIDGSALSYRPRLLDVEGWAGESGQTDPVLLGFGEWQEEERVRGAGRTVAGLAEGKIVSEAEQEEAERFFAAFLYAYWHGALAQVAESLGRQEGFGVFCRIAEGTGYGPWVSGLMADAAPELAGFTIEFRAGTPRESS